MHILSNVNISTGCIKYTISVTLCSVHKIYQQLNKEQFPYTGAALTEYFMYCERHRG